MNAQHSAHPLKSTSTAPLTALPDYLSATNAEGALVGGLLVDPSQIPSILELARPEHCARPKLRTVFEAELRVWKRGEHVDKVAVFEELRRSSLIDELGGPEKATLLLTKLLDAVPTAASLAGYANMVRRASVRRKAYSALHIAPGRVDAGDDLDATLRVLRDITDELELLESGGPEAKIHTVSAADIKIKRLEWLMYGRVLAGEVQILDGPGGVGKSTIAISIIAAATAGLLLPDGTTLPKRLRALVLAEEDGFSMFTARLKIAGADLRRIDFADFVSHRDGRPRSITLPKDVAELERKIRDSNADLLYIDAFLSHIDNGLDAHRAQDIRAVLRPLVELAHRTGCTILVTRHWAKSAGTAASRGMGSTDIRNVARSVLSCGQHPTRYEDERIHAITVSKSNYGPPVDALLYRIVSVPFTDDDGREFEGGVGRIEWLGADSTTADDIAGPPETREEKSNRSDARDAILEYLSDGPKSAEEMKKYGKFLTDSQDIPKWTFIRARGQLHAERAIVKTGGGGAGPVVWSLAADCTADRSLPGSDACNQRNEPAKSDSLESQCAAVNLELGGSGSL